MNNSGFCCDKWEELVGYDIYVKDKYGTIEFVYNIDDYTVSYEEDDKNLKFVYCPYCKAKL